MARGDLENGAPPENVFVVAAVDYSESCGGCTVLHRLCDRLNVLFDDTRKVPLCYLSSLYKADLILNAEYKTPLLPAWFDIKDGVVIYPEITHGNPLTHRALLIGFCTSLVTTAVPLKTIMTQRTS